VKTVETGEERVKALGFRQFRVRFHGEIVRLEIARDEMPKALTIDMAQRFTAIFKDLGFRYVTLDLEGYARDPSTKCWICSASELVFVRLLLLPLAPQ